jgi:hypothetical protein
MPFTPADLYATLTRPPDTFLATVGGVLFRELVAARREKPDAPLHAERLKLADHVLADTEARLPEKARLLVPGVLADCDVSALDDPTKATHLQVEAAVRRLLLVKDQLAHYAQDAPALPPPVERTPPTATPEEDKGPEDKAAAARDRGQAAHGGPGTHPARGHGGK